MAKRRAGHTDKLGVPNAVSLYINRRRNFGGAVGGGGGGGGAGGGTLSTFPNLAQAASAAGSRYLLSYNQFDATANLARVNGTTNTTLGLPFMATNYAKNLAELVDLNGVAAFSAAAAGITPNIPAVAALGTQIWWKGRTRIDEIQALAVGTAGWVCSIDADGAGGNKKIEVYWQMQGSGLSADLAAAVWSTGNVRTVVAATPAILFTAWPPLGCYLNWAVGYDAAAGTLTLEFREDGGTTITDSGFRTSTVTLSTFPVFTGSLVTNTLTNLGATSILLSATTLVGTIANQSTFTIGGVVYTATAAATAAANVLTVPVAATGVSIPAGTAAAFTSGPLLNTDGGANGRISLNRAFNGGATGPVALRHAGLAVYSGAMATTSPPAGTVNRWQPGQPGDANLLGLWFMGDKTSGALTSLAPAVQGGVPITITGTAAGAFDNGAVNGWPLFPLGPGGLCTDENLWKEFHFITSMSTPTAGVFTHATDATIALCRAQGTPHRGYLFEGVNDNLNQGGGYTALCTSPATTTQVLQTVVTNIVGYNVTKWGTAAQGGVREWNIVNEFLQGGNQSSPHTPFFTQLGAGWVTLVAQMVHAIDPTAMIMINTDNIELASQGAQKTAQIAAINALIAGGIPAGKIISGYEFHLRTDVGYTLADGAAFKAHIAALPAGVWWCASECDVTDVLLDGGAGNPNVGARLARAAQATAIWNTFFASVLTNDPTSWASVWSFGGWQLSPITSWINTNTFGVWTSIGQGIARIDGDLEYCCLLDENYARMGGVGSPSDVYGAWMTMFVTHAGAVPTPPVSNTPNMPAGLRVVFNSGAMTPASVVIPASPVRGSSLQFNGPVPGTMVYLSPGQGVDDDPANLTFAQNAGSDAGPYGLRTTFPVGKVSDPALCLELPLSPQGVRKIYMAYDGRLPPGFSLASFKANAMKFGNPKDNGGNDNIIMAFLGFQAGSGYYPGAGIQGPVTVNIPNNNSGQFGAKFFQPGDIPRFEHLWVSDNPLGGGNGQYTIWQDNVLAVTKTLELEGIGASLGFRDMVLYISRAVTGGNPTVAWYWDWNNMVIALDG